MLLTTAGICLIIVELALSWRYKQLCSVRTMYQRMCSFKHFSDEGQYLLLSRSKRWISIFGGVGIRDISLF